MFFYLCLSLNKNRNRLNVNYTAEKYIYNAKTIYIYFNTHITQSNTLIYILLLYNDYTFSLPSSLSLPPIFILFTFILNDSVHIFRIWFVSINVKQSRTYATSWRWTLVKIQSILKSVRTFNCDVYWIPCENSPSLLSCCHRHPPTILNMI